MPLPKIVAPTYELELPSSGRPVKFRPFLVKEEKVLMLASETENPKEVANAMKSVIKNCLISKIKVEDLASFDIEYLFLNIRGKSVGEELNLTLICPDDGETQVKTNVNLEDIKVQFPEGHTNEIELDDNLTLILKYPSMDMFLKMNFSGETPDGFELLSECVDKIISPDEVWEAAECTKKEIMDFIESMTSEQFLKVNKFFETMPKLQHKVMVTNPKTEVESEITLEGLGDFFG